jgi:hypothetical protein
MEDYQVVAVMVQIMRSTAVPAIAKAGGEIPRMGVWYEEIKIATDILARAKAETLGMTRASSGVPVDDR